MRNILIVLAITMIPTIGIFERDIKKDLIILVNEDNDGLCTKALKEELKDLRNQVPEEIPEKQMPKYDIPLDVEIQEYLYNKCVEHNVPYELALAIIKNESDFNPKETNKNEDGSIDRGIMQINSVHIKEFKKQGLSDMFNPYENINFGIILLANLCSLYEDEHRILMAYNFGIGGEKKVASRGITSSIYSRKVIKYKK